MSAADLSGRRVVVLGASGLIGAALARDLAAAGAEVTAVARRFAPQQRAGAGVRYLETPFVDLSSGDLAELVREAAPEVLANAAGALGSDTADAVHGGLVSRLLDALDALPGVRLVQVSVPGTPDGDATAFSRTKRAADAAILAHAEATGRAHAILRPGFVWAPVAFGGSALLRALAALPVDLPAAERARPFRAVAVEDVAATVRHLVAHAPAGPVVWDLMHPEALTLGSAVDALRGWLGMGAPRAAFPRLLLGLGARLGDLAARLGWRPPVRSVTLAELRRGVEGDPAPWLAATGIVPRPFAETLAARPAGVQERWFARLFLLKPLWIVTLAAFWVLSGSIALFVSYDAAHAILIGTGWPAPLAHLVTVVSSLTDIGVGLLLLHRRTSRAGLILGIAVSLFYMMGAAVLTPAMWVEPLGALVKTFPAIVLMLVALATLEDR